MSIASLLWTVILVFRYMMFIKCAAVQLQQLTLKKQLPPQIMEKKEEVEKVS